MKLSKSHSQAPKQKFWLKLVPVLGIFTAFALAFAGDELPTRRISTSESAWQIWTEMTRSSLTFEPVEFQISPTAGSVSFGGEKEGGDSLITRIMSPSEKDFEIIVNTMGPKKRKLFLADFIDGMANEKYTLRTKVINAAGETLKNPAFPAKKDYSKLSIDELDKEFKTWNSQTQDRPFSFLRQKVRAQIYDGEFAGMNGKDWIDRAMKAYPRAYDPTRATDPVPTHFNNWQPIFGEPEKYISRMITELIGIWELNFRPQISYGEFEKMMSWFRETLKDEDGPYSAFGHQWVVLPKREVHSSTMRKIVQKKLTEVYKSTQALIALRGIKLQSGILTSMYNEVRSDEALKSHELERSVIRLKNNLFPSNTGAPALNIEQRSGTSLNPSRRTVQQAIISRYASDDWSGLVDADKYVLVDNDPSKMVSSAQDRFGVTDFEMKRAVERIKSVVFEGDEEMVQGLRDSSLAPFWYWENTPYISATKKALLKKVTRNFIQQLAALPPGNNEKSMEAVLAEFARWSAITDIDTDIENYLRPKPKLVENTPFGHFKSPLVNPKVNVNEQEFGIEYTTRFPLRASSVFTEQELKLGKKGFLQLEYDMTPDEKREVIREIAARLAQKLNGKKIEPVRVDAEGHGHKIAITYEIPTPTGQTWRVEWDGIGRDYDLDGNVLTGSERGGVVEIVTPKFNPDEKSVGALFSVFKELGIYPSYNAGGGHINFDLAAFNGKPRELARFIALFLETRDVITAMFQYPGRFSTAEPVEVSQKTYEWLKNFDGSEEELKKLLYNEEFFNSRLGRKTKYMQLELSSYFQDVIPEEYVTKDFDVKNGVWRKQFRVSPGLRKGEFRLFGAPRSKEEASLQLKIVRAMMDKALNDTTPLTGSLQEVNVEKMVADPVGSFKRFEQSMDYLSLNATEYEGFYAEGLQSVSNYVTSSFYEPYEKKMRLFPKTDGWKSAVPARSAENALSSKGREFNPELTEDAALKLRKDKDKVKLQTEKARAKAGIKTDGNTLGQDWREFDKKSVAKLKKLEWNKLIQYPEIALDFIYERDVEEDASPREIFTHLADLKRSVEKAAEEKYGDGIRQRLQVQDAYDNMVKSIIKFKKGKIEFERAQYYVNSMQHGEIAAEVAAEFIAKGTPEQRKKFFKAIGSLYVGPSRRRFQDYVASFVTSIDLRRALYGTLGDRYETAWGDMIEDVYKDIFNVDDTKNIHLDELAFLNRAIRALLSKNEVSLGAREREMLVKYDKKSRELPGFERAYDNLSPIRKRTGLEEEEGKKSRTLEEEDSMSALINRKCSKLLFKEAR